MIKEYGEVEETNVRLMKLISQKTQKILKVKRNHFKQHKIKLKKHEELKK
jgi:hypothetical protein